MEKIKIVFITGFSGLIGSKTSLFYFKTIITTYYLKNTYM